MKVIEKIKKVVIGIGLFVSTISTKAFATYIEQISKIEIQQSDYGSPGSPKRTKNY